MLPPSPFDTVMQPDFIVKIRRVRPNSANPLPCYMTTHSAGMDLYAEILEDIVLFRGERVLVPTGIALELPDGYEAQIRPRSGLALRNGVTLVNSPGTIDPDYRGEIGIIVINHGEESFVIKSGERIAQMVFSRFVRAAFLEVEELGETARGKGGFGHTGT